MTNLAEVQIDIRALQSNVSSLRALLSPTQQVAAVVKANAYGHGLAQVVRALEKEVDYFQVDDISELRELRDFSKAKALVLGYVPQDSLPELLGLDAEIGVFDYEHLRSLGEAARAHRRPATAHLKIDALLGRLGTLPTEIEKLLDEANLWPEISIVGVYGHYANIEDTTDLVHAQEQHALFANAASKIRTKYPEAITHMSATSGAMAMSTDPEHDLVRLGIGVYGLYPSRALARSHDQLALRPVLRWVSRLAQVKILPPRHPVGYGLTYSTYRETRIGIVPQGYSDGYDRGLSNSGEVLVRGRRCPVIGRVAMNMFAVDLRDVPDAEREDEVVLLGKQEEDEITAEEIATKLGTINYEVVTRISPLLPRVALDARSTPWTLTTNY